MSNLIQTFLQADVALSARLTLVADVLCAIGGLAVVAAVVTRRGAIRRGASPSRAVTSLPITFLVATMLTMFAVVLARWNEVNHFPSQTMSEVLTMFSTALAVSMVVLNFALGLQRRGGGWAILNDVLILLVLAGVFGTHAWIRGLSTAQRDLPPALQSYWFPWHLSALIFSYATMSIAAFVCLLFFVTRFWSGVFLGGQSKKSQWLTAAALVLIPFVHVVTLPILALSGIVFWILLKSGKLPQGAELAKLEKTFDDVSFRTFAVGFPFLTAGVWMGAFWAQEAWANYWGWDSKENSALITWLVYVVYIHLRMLGGYRGAKAMSVLVGGAVSVFLTFQLFGYLPDSQKSLHRYTDDGVTPQEGQAGPAPAANEQASLEAPRTDRAMSAALIDGKKIAADVRAEVKRGAQGLIARGVQPGLAVVLVGDDPASQVYVRNKDKAAREAGFAVRTLELPATVAQADLERVVRELNADRSVHGILVQLPLPRGLDARAVVDLIDPSKDVDGLTPANVAALVQGRAGHRPCTPLGCLVLLDRTDVPLEGRHVVVIGRSLLVGKPFALMALERNATVTVAHSRTRDLAALVVQADVVVAAVGRAGLVRGAWIRPGAVVLDVGINRGPDGRLAGDVEFEAASQRAAAITPVPGGVGPMTIALLLSNTLAAAQSLSPASP